MNRVYLDPNTKYSDQYAMLAKMPDIVDAVNDVADAVEDIPEIPAPAVADIGKVLGVVSDGESGAEYGAVAPSGGLPAIESGDAGKVLTVNAGETGAEWAAVPAELPAIGDSDAGKVLKVNAGHTGVEWGAAGGGVMTVYFEDDGETITASKTYAEIYDELDAGNLVLGYAAESDICAPGILKFFTESFGSPVKIRLSQIGISSDLLTVYMYTMDSNNTITYSSLVYTLTPST